MPTADEIVAYLGSYDEDFSTFDLIEHPPSRMPDVCALLRLEAICPKDRGSYGVSWVAHDVMYLRWDENDLAGRASQADLLYLKRCGVTYHDGCLAMLL